MFYPEVHKICILYKVVRKEKDGQVWLNSTKFKLSVLFRDSEICFPVGTLENEMNLAPERMKIKMQLEAGMEMLQSIKGKIQHATRLREKAIKKLKKMSKNYNKLMDQVEAVKSRK